MRPKSDCREMLERPSGRKICSRAPDPNHQDSAQISAGTVAIIKQSLDFWIAPYRCDHRSLLQATASKHAIVIGFRSQIVARVG
ncbi:hypothetical protein BDBG_16150 [Blastomyces gilchristii SLH14081]|uniref:Uncharacterized protein n=1 Tax=Blastomyces gilchristii (strain SLH14081) TaxID=559298 RepID=A0A179UBN5_BLAGS|nr:uncharacterized protein BDBG_16150 [Blastomyces gilchristii SLH14081]OAT03942.1 hypothetical protein BDBG_16150 [Blastomyces gilchristii SLH14081]